ncbi:MAG: chemotaxis response regulator protein-glutamate methylesterase [Desulfosudaceae bacterium]
MNDTDKLKILVVDDTILYRKIISEVLSSFPGVEIAGTASNGKTAIARIASLKPDLITLDVDMPSMDGIEVLVEINRLQYDVGVIMLSSLTREGSELTVKALELGAFDFIPKPELESIEAGKQYIKDHLAPMLRSFGDRRTIKKILSGQSTYRRPPQTTPIIEEKPRRDQETAGAMPPSYPAPAATGQPWQGPSKVVTIGISTGGPKALARIIPLLPPDIKVPVLIVQHMPALFTKSLAKSLNAKSTIRVVEAQDEEFLLPGTVYLAPGGKQMRISPGPDHRKIINITDDPPENSCKPSVDYLFRSVAENFGRKITGVIMTGMGSDGYLGIRAMKSAGALIIAQDEATCTVFGMPKKPIESGLVDVVAPLDDIVAEIVNSVKMSG